MSQRRDVDLVPAIERWYHQGTPLRLPDPATVRALAEVREGRELADTSLLIGRAAWLGGDAAATRRWATLATTLHPSDAVAVGARSLCFLADLLAGIGTDEPAGTALTAEASSARLATAVVDLTAGRALAALASGDLPAATDLARRASRMAASEATPDLLYVANLTLARVRRHGGKPHLAAKILGALAPDAPPAVRAWIQWEQQLCGAADPGGGPHEDEVADAFSPLATRACRALSATLAAARAGARELFAGARSALEANTATLPAWGREARALVEALDPHASISDEVRDWRDGTSAFLPFGLDGVNPSDPTDDPRNERTGTYVLAKPGQPGRRLVRLGLALAGDVARPQQFEQEPEETRSFHRTDAALAALALGPPQGQPIADLFRSVYGFAYAPLVHAGVLKVLVHRMRRRLGDLGEIQRDGETLRLAAARPFLVADPRCAQPTVERVLRLIVRAGSLRTKEIAAGLHLSVRTVQEALAQLVADGSCLAEKSGRETRYRVEDTTFSDPTALRRWTSG